MREKKVLPRAVEIQKQNWGEPRIFFLDMIKLQFGKNCHRLLCILTLFEIVVPFYL